jgi:hypothetical protein
MLPKTEEDFRLTSPTRKSRRQWLPEKILGIEVATPLEAAVTIIILVRGEFGGVIRVPVVWCPSTNIIKRMTHEPWKEFGVTQKISRIRERATNLARNEHVRNVQKYATRDLFEEDEE